MAKAALDAPHFKDETAAFAFVEDALWPNGPVCPFCGETERVGRLAGKTTRAGLCKCYKCRKPFTVRIGTIFEGSHLPLHMWLQVIHVMCAGKKGISSLQIQRMLGCSMTTAWFLTHRIREAMAPAKDAGPLGGAGKIVEADETFLSNSKRTKKRPGYQHKVAIMSLVERGGQQRSVVLEGPPNRPEIRSVIYDNVDPASILHTDGAQYYKGMMPTRGQHKSVNHSAGEYARKAKGGTVHVNSLEGFFSVFKRGMIGTYQHVSETHMPRYVAEFDFRQNHRAKLGFNDTMRAEILLKAFKGKRLTYKKAGGRADTEASSA